VILFVRGYSLLQIQRRYGNRLLDFSTIIQKNIILNPLVKAVHIRSVKCVTEISSPSTIPSKVCCPRPHIKPTTISSNVCFPEAPRKLTTIPSKALHQTMSIPPSQHRYDLYRDTWVEHHCQEEQGILGEIPTNQNNQPIEICVLMATRESQE
jgi:hypothetical protein